MIGRIPIFFKSRATFRVNVVPSFVSKPRPIVILTGGDPFKRDDIFDLVAYGTEIGLPIAVSPSGTPLLNLARLAGLYALLDLIGYVLGFIPLIGWLITLIFYIGFFSDLFETDWQDAFLVIFLTGAVKIALAVLLVMYLPALLSVL